MDWIRESTIGNVLKRQASARGDKIFLHYMDDDRKFSYRDVHLLSNRIGNALLAHGIGKGVHVASLLHNSPEQALFYFALGKIGAVSVPVNTASRGAFLEYYVNQSDSTAIIVDQSLLEVVEEVLPRTRIDRVIVLGDPQGGDIPAGRNLISFDQLLEGSEEDPPVEVRYDDLAALAYTSGTTGPSKGNMYTQAGTLYFAVNVVEALGVTEDDIYYVCFPLFHSAAWNSAVLTMLQFGGGVALTRKFSASNYLREAKRSNATIFNLLSVGSFLLSQPPSAADRDHKLRVGIAVPMPVHADEFEDRFGVTLVGAFGISDYCAAFALKPHEAKAKRGSVGKPFDMVDVRLVDDEDFEVPVGTSGELLLRHKLPWVTATGYYKMPDETAAANRGLWFHTGDRMYRDEDGYYYFVDRKKDSIRRRGENISSFEVENVIGLHEAVAEVAVYAVKASTGEDDVGVSIVIEKEHDLTEIDLIAYCERNLPKYMVPRFVHIASELPKTLTLKVKKHELRDFVHENRHLVWDREKMSRAVA